MKTKALKLPPQTVYAAQNAREGLIGVADLSVLTGVDVGLLNKYAKMGTVAHYGEYHGKRFFNFQEIVNWLHDSNVVSEAKPVIREKMEELMQKRHCPYTLEKAGGKSVRIIWKEVAEAA